MDPDDVDPPGRGEWWSVQHRRPAGMGGTKAADFNSPANVVLLCGHGTTGCHGEVEIERDQARVDGWLVRQSGEPSRNVIRPKFTRPRLLLDDWSYQEVDDDR